MLSLKTDVNVPTVRYSEFVISKKNLVKETYFWGHLESHYLPKENSRIRIRNPLVHLPGSGSVSKRHGSGTLLLRLRSFYNFDLPRFRYLRYFHFLLVTIQMKDPEPHPNGNSVSDPHKNVGDSKI
jgi:hypothetical protein